MYKVPRLFAIRMDSDRFTAQDVAEEDCKNTLVRVRQTLPHAVHIKHPQGSYIEAKVEVSAQRGCMNITLRSVFGDAIIRYRIGHRAFGRWNNRWVAVNSHRTGEQQTRYTIRDTLLENINGAQDINAEVLGRVHKGQADRGLTRDMEHRIEADFKYGSQVCLVAYIAEYKPRSRINLSTGTTGFVVQCGDRVPIGNKSINDVTADKS